MRHVPVQLTLRELAASAARQHPSARSVAAVDKIRDITVTGDGRMQAVDPDSTLLQNGFRDYDRVHLPAVRFGSIRVVFAAAGPLQPDGAGLESKSNGAAAFAEELRQITDSSRLGQIELVGEFSHARRADLRKIMNLEPDILHLSCHSVGEAFILEDEDGDAVAVPADQFVSQVLDRRAGPRLSAIILNRCAGERIAPIIVEGAAPVIVIAHRNTPTDLDAVYFAENFYRELSRVPDLRGAAAQAQMDDMLILSAGME